VRLLVRTTRTWRSRPASAQWVAASGPPDKVVPVGLHLWQRREFRFAADVLAATDLRDVTARQGRRIGQVLMDGGRHADAIPVLLHVIDAMERSPDVYTEFRRSRDVAALEQARLHVVADDHCRAVPAPREQQVKGFVLLYNPGLPVLTGLMVPLVRPLMEQGNAVAAVAAGTITTARTGVPEFDRLQGLVAPDGMSLAGRRRIALQQQWQVDWAAGVVAADGINYHAYFQERLAQKARRYRADPTADPATAERFTLLLQRADVALTFCKRLPSLAEATGKPVRIALMDSHFAPQGIVREWCDRVGRNVGVHAVVLSVGYENYYSNLSTLEATTLAVEDLTAQPELRQPFLGGRHRIEAALAEDPSLDGEPDERVMSWVRQDRSKVTGDVARRAEVTERARSVRSRGGSVYVALGKVSIDFAAPGDRGFAHEDFVDWINHLIEAVAGSRNLLLVKPHPHELREEIVGRGVQLLRELVPAQLPENVCFLEHDAYNTHELAELVDTAFVWNGTACAEFPLLGVPAVPASIWGPRDYPVGLPVLRTREEYAEVLRGERVVELPPSSRRRAAVLLRLMRSDHVAMPFRYLRRPATNQGIGAMTLDAGQLAALRDTPDPYVLRAASRFFEFP
jgi:hypothetical protein